MLLWIDGVEFWCLLVVGVCWCVWWGSVWVVVVFVWLCVVGFDFCVCVLVFVPVMGLASLEARHRDGVLSGFGLVWLVFISLSLLVYLSIIEELEGKGRGKQTHCLMPIVGSGGCSKQCYWLFGGQ